MREQDGAHELSARSARVVALLRSTGRLYLIINIVLTLGSVAYFATTDPAPWLLLLTFLGWCVGVVQSVLVYAGVAALAVLVEQANEIRRARFTG